MKPSLPAVGAVFIVTPSPKMLAAAQQERARDHANRMLWIARARYNRASFALRVARGNSFSGMLNQHFYEKCVLDALDVLWIAQRELERLPK